LETKDGITIHGVILLEGDPLMVQSASGLTQMVPRKRIAERKALGRSLTMSADQLGVTPQDLAGLAAWLRTH